MTDKAPSPIQALIDKFNQKPSFEARSVKGAVVGCDVLEREGMKFYAVHIKNGSLTESFWIAHDPANSQFHQPLHGDWVSGIVNTFDDCISFADLTLKPIFDFNNSTHSNEESHFAWFRQRAAEQEAEEAAAQTVAQALANARKNGNKPE